MRGTSELSEAMFDDDAAGRSRPLLQHQSRSFSFRSEYSSDLSSEESGSSFKRKMLADHGRAWTMATKDEKRLQEYASTHTLEKVSFAAIARSINIGDIDDVDYPRLSRLVKRGLTMAELITPEPTVAPTEEQAGLQSNSEAIVNLLNNCLGSGMLTMGFAFAKAGILPSIATMLLSAYLNRFTLLLNIDSCAIAQCDAASAALGEHAFGSAGRIVLVVLYTTFAFLCCVSYVTATADSLSGILQLFVGEALAESRSVLLVAAWAVLLLPTTLVRSLKAVAALSFVAFVGGVVMLVSVACYCGTYLLANGLPDLAVGINWLAPSVSDYFAAMPILLLVFSIQPGGGTVLATMQDSSVQNIRAVSLNAYLLVFAMDLTIGVIAYVTFTSEVQGNVLLNFSPTSPVALVARLALLDLVVLSYMIMMIPCKLSLLDLLFDKNEARGEASPVEFYGCTLVLNCLALGVALGVSDLSVVNGLNGAVCTNLVAFVLPILFRLKLAPAGDGGSAPPVLCLANLPYLAILAFGLFSLALGTAQLVQTLAG